MADMKKVYDDLMIINLYHKVASSMPRGVARGGAEGARAPPEFGRSVNPIQTRGGRLCPSHYCQPPRIQKAIYSV